MCIHDQFRGERIRTLTCDAGRARGGVGKLRGDLLSPIIHFCAKRIRAAQTDFERKKIGKREGIYLKKERLFCDKNMPADCSVRGMKGWARIPMLGAECATAADGRYEKHLAVKHPGWKAEVVGPKPYRATVWILWGSGEYPMGRKINSRWAVMGNADL